MIRALRKVPRFHSTMIPTSPPIILNHPHWGKFNKLPSQSTLSLNISQHFSTSPPLSPIPHLIHLTTSPEHLAMTSKNDEHRALTNNKPDTKSSKKSQDEIEKDPKTSHEKSVQWTSFFNFFRVLLFITTLTTDSHHSRMRLVSERNLHLTQEKISCFQRQIKVGLLCNSTCI